MNKPPPPATAKSNATDPRLKSYIERIERLEDDKKNVATDIKEVYVEVKSAGYDPKIVRQVVKLRKMDTVDRENYEALLDQYLAAVGLL